MALSPRILFPIFVLLLVSPTLATELRYKEYAKASEPWKRVLCVRDLSVHVCGRAAGRRATLSS
jgi:hypothetical protein